jgi:hypothetical protein
MAERQNQAFLPDRLLAIDKIEALLDNAEGRLNEQERPPLLKGQ